MALGKQFEDTYWEDPATGETKSWTREQDPAGIPRMSPTTKTNAPDNELSGHQGLLFHPATATGTKDDPLVPIERRQAAATSAVGGENTDSYKSRVRQETGRKISSKMADTEIGLLRDSVVNSGMRTQDMEKTKVSAYLNPRRPNSGFAEEHSNYVMVGRQTVSERVPVPESKGFKTTASDTPIYNPKFWDWMSNNTNMHDSEVQGEQILNYTMGDDAPHDAYKGVNVHWQNPETGETVQGEDAIEKATSRTYGPLLQVAEENHKWWKHDYDPEEHGPYDPNDQKFEINSGRETVNAENLERAGFIPNIFPGEGKSSKKSHVDKRFEIEKRWNDAQSREVNATMHTRFVPGSAEPVTIPATTKIVKTSRIDDDTVIHEIGHQVDNVMGDKYSHRHRVVGGRDRWGYPKRYAKADPLEEGYADGFEDRYGSMSNVYEDVLSDPTHPNNNMGRSNGMGASKYGVNSSNWKNDTHKALYVASRAASQTGEDGRQNYPSREEIADSLGINTKRDVNSPENHKHGETVNTMALGHMLTTTPSLMKHLKGQGLHDVGKQARSAYIDARRNRSREQNGGWEQPTLPGFEDR